METDSNVTAEQCGLSRDDFLGVLKVNLSRLTQ